MRRHKFFRQIAEGDDLVRAAEPPFYYEAAIDIALTALPGTRTSVEFLARVLHGTPDYVIATPLYVALAD